MSQVKGENLFSDSSRTWYTVCLVTSNDTLCPLYAYAHRNWAEQAAELEQPHRVENVIVKEFTGDVPGCAIFLV